MVESNPTDQPTGEQPTDSRYFGPFGEPPVDYRFASQAETQPPQLTYAAPSGGWPPPAEVAAGAPPSTAPAADGGRRTRPAALIGVAAATALLVGGAAGYGGALLAERNSTPVAAPGSGPVTQGSGASPSPPAVSSEPLPPGGSTMDTVAVAKRALAGTVTIQVGRSTGSGFLIDDQGRILTNNHVVASAPRGATIPVNFTDGRRQTATLVGRSPSYDLAAIKVKPARYLRPV